MCATEVLPTVRCLASLAQGGPVLEFAIGTGRVALALAARGIEVPGIDLSAVMRAKPGSNAIQCVQGDMTCTRIEGSYSLVYLVFNTIMNLTHRTSSARASRSTAPSARC